MAKMRVKITGVIFGESAYEAKVRVSAHRCHMMMGLNIRQQSDNGFQGKWACGTGAELLHVEPWDYVGVLYRRVPRVFVECQ